jgi:tetratricopeptide (TPR) repeat protein
LAACRKAIELEPDLAEAHNHLGSCFLGQSRLEEALAACRKAIELEPDLVSKFFSPSVSGV